MSLPNLNEDVNYKQIDLLSGKKIGVKRWKVKEEKSLLFSVEGNENDEEVLNEITKFVKSCCDDPKKFDTLSRTDIVHSLSQMRKMSKGSKIEYNYDCEECKFPLTDEVNIDQDIKTKKFKSEPIKIGDNLIFSIKELSAAESDAIRLKYTKVSEYNYHFILKSIESIVFKKEVYEEFTEAELIEFIDGMDSEDLETLADKINEAQAEISIEKILTCGKCEHVNKITFGGLESFLAF